MSLIETVERLYEKGDYSDALELTLRVLENEPNNVRALELKASLLYVKNRLPESIQAYKELLRFYGSNDKVWRQLFAFGSISSGYWFLKDYDNAISYCEKSIKLCERFLKFDSLEKDGFIDQLFGTLWNLGEYQCKARQYSCAIDTYKKLLKLLSEFGCLKSIAEALYELASVYYVLNRPTEALSKFLEALELQEGAEETFRALIHKYKAHYYIGSILFATRDFKKALFHLDRCVLFIEEFYAIIDEAGIEKNFTYKRAKRLQNSLNKNKFLWKKRFIANLRKLKKSR